MAIATRICILLLPLSLALSSCEILSDPGSSGSSGGQRQTAVAGSGTVQLLQHPGGPIFWGILTDGGIRYEVLDMPGSYQEDGLRVKFAGEERFVATPTFGYGTTIVLTSIEKI